jgi:hypothetical protein
MRYDLFRLFANLIVYKLDKEHNIYLVKCAADGSRKVWYQGNPVIRISGLVSIVRNLNLVG